MPSRDYKLTVIVDEYDEEIGVIRTNAFTYDAICYDLASILWERNLEADEVRLEDGFGNTYRIETQTRLVIRRATVV